MLVKKACLGLQNPVTSAEEIFLSLLCASTYLIWYVMGKRKFSTTDQLLEIR